MPLNQIDLDWATWQRSSPNRKSFPFLIPDNESPSWLPVSGSQDHQGGDASALHATKAKGNEEKYANVLYWPYLSILLNVKIHPADTMFGGVFLPYPAAGSPHYLLSVHLPKPFPPLFSCYSPLCFLFSQGYSYVCMILFIYGQAHVPGAQVSLLRPDHFR